MVVSGKPRRYLVFYGSDDLKLGGWNDYFRSFESPRDARREIERLQRDYPTEVGWWHIIDVHEGMVVMRSDDKPKD